jgi:diguanylate cyclase (GGDEF)-like protein
LDGGSTIAQRDEEGPDRLAKDWLLRLIERTPLDEVAEIPVSWIAAEAPPLIAEIVAALRDPGDETASRLEDAARQRLAALARSREGTAAAEQIPRHLAALQALLVEAIRREIPERRAGEFADAVERLAEVFGSVQGAVMGRLVDERSGGSQVDELTGLPGPVQLEEWLRLLLADQQRYEQGFAIAMIDIDGLGKINEAYGRDAGDRLLTAVAGVIERQIGVADRAFRLGEDELCVVAPRQDTAELAPIAERIAALVADSQASEGPRIGIAIGIAACPADGTGREELFEAAEQATYAAKAAGESVAVSPGGSPEVVKS